MTDDAINAIRTACADLGITPPPSDVLIADARVRRYHDPLHDKPGERNGWIKCCDNLDGTYGGTAGHWRLGIKSNWHSRTRREYTAEERAEYGKRMAAARQREQAERENRQRRAAQKADAIWRAAKPADPKHHYLLIKRIKAHGIRQYAGSLVVPLRDSTGHLHSLQFIDGNSNKRFLSGGLTSGCYWSVGPKPADTLLLAEGMATTATLFEASGLPAVAAMNAGNLVIVAVALHEKYPAVRILVCADADPVGRKAAAEAAELVGGLVIEPDFGGANG